MTETLTREMILAEPAGPRLDAWVRERVLGRPVVRQTALGHEFCFTDEVGLMGRNPVPKYSLDIASAWVAVENLGRRYMEVTVDTGSKSPNCHVRVWKTMFPKWEQCAAARTAPLAICRAALLAVLERNPAPGEK